MRKPDPTKNPPTPLQLVRLGDQAVLAYWSNEASAWQWAEQVRKRAPKWLQDVVTAYLTVGVFYDADVVEPEEVCHFLRSLPLSESQGGHDSDTLTRLWSIPVCYGEEWGPDLQQVAAETALSPEAVVHLHQSKIYRVYAIGFVPGFPYMGYLPSELCGVSRLPSPRREVPAGSIGIAGRQTGIYPLSCPGGWRIVGRTPLIIVDLDDAYFPLAVGDAVRFYTISSEEFQRLQGRRLDFSFLVPCAPPDSNGI